MRSYASDVNYTRKSSYTGGTQTYKMQESKIEGIIDELESLKQAVYKRLSTEQFEYPVYSFKYGLAIHKLLGKDREYVSAELPRMVKETLMEDDRINSVSNFVITYNGDICMCSMSVSSIYGEFNAETEVNI